jgi:hypothetical protein
MQRLLSSSKIFLSGIISSVSSLHLTAACVAVLLAVFTAPAQAQVVVIAHKAVSVPTLDAPTLNNMYSLFKKDIGGTKLVLFDLKTDAPSKEKFYTFIGKPPAEMKKIWLRSQLTGGGSPPTNVTTEEEMVDKVASTPGAVGYVSQDKVNDKVKVLATIK